MHTPGSEPSENGSRGVGAAVKDVTEHAKALVGLEVELAKVELSRKLGSLGLGIGLAVVGALLALYGLGFLFATVAAAFDTFLPRWLSLLLVTVLLFALAGGLVALGLSRIRRGTPPVPEQAIAEAKRTTEAIKG